MNQQMQSTFIVSNWSRLVFIFNITYFQMDGWIFLSESRIVRPGWNILPLLINCWWSRKSNYWKRLLDLKRIINSQSKTVWDKKWDSLNFSLESHASKITFPFINFSISRRYIGLLKIPIAARAIVAVQLDHSIWKYWTFTRTKWFIWTVLWHVPVAASRVACKVWKSRHHPETESVQSNRNGSQFMTFT